MCKRLEPKTAMLTCDSCSMMVHTCEFLWARSVNENSLKA